ncbi:type I secretion C-terminal target domain-containing protein [Oxalobacter sp. OttesenSCG-928-P03]|nr:type I secretion C-terminal target domain-containing protein [Oxalobacter sp. OttesenSCG-928-P03]
MNEKTGTDILDISDLISGYEGGGVSGGYLKFDPVAVNSDGTTTLKLSIGTESEAAGNVPLATIVMANTDVAAADTGNFTQHILEQLVQHNDIVF